MKIKGEIGQDGEIRLSVNGKKLAIVGMDFEIEIGLKNIIVREEVWLSDEMKEVARKAI